MREGMTRFIQDTEGATAIEYGLIGALVSIVILTLLQNIGVSLNAVFQKVADALSDVAG